MFKRTKLRPKEIRINEPKLVKQSKKTEMNFKIILNRKGLFFLDF